jgi:polyprenyl-phospho-N-acetylgalactosaminyl synthase
MPATWIIIPAFNEAARIGQTLRSLTPHFENIIVVDDCSHDATAELARQAGAEVVRHPVNLGQGAALQTGLAFAKAKGATEVVTFDADGQHQADDAVRMLETLRGKGVDVVLGSRFLGAAIDMPRRRAQMLQLATWYTRITTGLNLSDTHNGLRVFGPNALATIDIRLHRMAHASEILAQIAQNKLRYIEVPCTIAYTSYSLAKGQKLTGAFDILFDLMVRKLSK